MSHCCTSSAYDLHTYRFGKNSDETKYPFLRTSIISALKTLLETTIHNIRLMPFNTDAPAQSQHIQLTGMLCTVSGAWRKKPVDDYTTSGFKMLKCYTNKINTSFTTFIFYSYHLVVD
jgi:hypothetical protein